MANPNPLPAEIHEKRGTFRPDRHAKSSLPVAIPRRPKGLSADGKRVWREITSLLERSRLVAEVDALTLKLLVDSVLLYDQATREAAGNLTITTDKGNVIQNPLVGVRNRAWMQILKVSQLFAMSPSARCGIPCGGDEPDGDDTASILFTVTE